MTITFEAGITLVFTRGAEQHTQSFRAGDTLRIAAIEEVPDTVLPSYTLRTADGWVASNVSAIGLFEHVTIYTP